MRRDFGISHFAFQFSTADWMIGESVRLPPLVPLLFPLRCDVIGLCATDSSIFTKRPPGYLDSLDIAVVPYFLRRFPGQGTRLREFGGSVPKNARRERGGKGASAAGCPRPLL